MLERPRLSLARRHQAPELDFLLKSTFLPYVWLETTRPGPENGRHFLFRAPVKTLVFTPEDSADVFFSQLEEALREGYWLAGFFSYEFGYFLEKRFRSFLLPEKVPLAWLGVFRAPEIFSAPLTASPARKIDFKNLSLSLSYTAYATALQRIKDYIAAGDTYQVNFTLKYHFETEASAEELYLALRPKQRVAYAGLIKTDDFAVLSFSPELFLRRKGLRLWTSPMKGTVRRGKTLAEDETLASWLASDRKNQAENVMIVDLLRNDLGRVCEPGSVFVRELFKVERYETLHQMISTVEGTLPASWRFYDLFQALFPCGSVTGAPKIRTMEIIAELEQEPRGVYTGAVGFLSPSGEFVFNVAIRTLVLAGTRGEFGIGSGVVWDSDPQQEYEECRLKARFLLSERPAFQLVETMLFRPEEGFPLKGLHLERLLASATYFGFSVDNELVEELLKEAAAALSVPAKVRLLLDETGSLTLEAYDLEPPPTPVSIGLMKRDVSKEEVFLYHKTTYRPWYEEARKRAQKEGIFDVVFWNEDGELTEGTITNLFLERNGKLYTPPQEAGLLPGVLRERLLREGRAEEARLTLTDLKQADRIYVGNAVRGLLPVGSWKLL